MHFLRLATDADRDALVALAADAGHGITTLPRTLEEVDRRVAQSAAGEAWLFVLEDAESGAIAGVSGLVPRLVEGEPFYTYRRHMETKHSDALGVTIEVESLHFVDDFHGPAELNTLFLSADARGGGLGRLLSLGRLLYAKQHLDAVAPVTIVELRGVVDAEGVSPFWKALCHHPFQVDYATADRLSATDRRFIADLFPEYPVYVHLLPDEAQAVIGAVHPLTEPARAILEAEGFVANGYVDIFDAGPMLRCETGKMRTVRDAATRAVRLWGDAADAPEPGGTRWLVATAAPPFRCVAVPAEASGGAIGLKPGAMSALGVGVGDSVWSVPIRAAGLGG